MTTRTHAFGAHGSRPRGRGLLQWLFDADAAHRQRHILRTLDPNLLSDIGVSRDEALSESRRALWDVPQNWRRSR